MIQHILELAAGIVSGIVVGLGFFRLLWLSTQKAVSSSKPVAVMVASFFGRLLAVVVLFALAFWWAPLTGVGAALGFLVARRLSLRPIRKELACD
jgi:F1F0 ATPase subunit 2